MSSRGTFETVTKVALAEIIRSHSQESKFGAVITGDSLEELVDDLFDLMLTSRTLKSAGDRFLQGSPTSSPAGRSRPTR